MKDRRQSKRDTVKWPNIILTRFTHTRKSKKKENWIQAQFKMSSDDPLKVTAMLRIAPNEDILLAIKINIKVIPETIRTLWITKTATSKLRIWILITKNLSSNQGLVNGNIVPQMKCWKPPRIPMVSAILISANSKNKGLLIEEP